MDKNLEIHIVSFTVPYPPNYGGVIDVFYKIKWLSKLGVKINLHCFKYDREESAELEKYCQSVNYYHRPKGLKYFLSKLPFIVKTRSNVALFNRLKSDQLPILFEGVHTTYRIKNLAINGRKIVVRTHNIEYEYYMNLARQEKDVVRKLYYSAEARKLKEYEQNLSSGIAVAAISEQDCKYFKTWYDDTVLVEAFHPNDQVKALTGLGEYILFHGNLAVNENIEAALYILKNICTQVNYPFKIAGKNPSPYLKKMSKKYPNVELIENPDQEEMEKLVQNAQINLLITFQNTGVKLKLINALHLGRHCLTNSAMAENSGLSKLCHVQDTSSQLIESINSLYLTPFSKTDLNKRHEILLKNVNNKHSAQKLINLLDKN